MKAFSKLATLVVMVAVMAASALAQTKLDPLTAPLANLTEGVGAITSSSNPQWDGLSEIVYIPGASLMGASSTTTVLHIGFTGGSEADIGNMVLYETARGNDTIIKVTKVTLGASSTPSIVLTDTSTCPVQPVSATSPCIVKLDTVKTALSPLFDYYFAIYFTLDTNNEKIVGTGISSAQGSLSGWYLYGDQTRIGAKGAIPTNENSDQSPFFLLYITNQ